MTISVLDTDDPRWASVKGGYKTPYNPLPALTQLQASPNDEAAWHELWQNLHHQGDVGEASYLAAVALIDMQRQGAGFDWNFYALVSVIEAGRNSRRNPQVPDWLKAPYAKAWEDILPLCLAHLQEGTFKDGFALRAVFAAIALAQGVTNLGKFLVIADSSDIDGYLIGRRLK